MLAKFRSIESYRLMEDSVEEDGEQSSIFDIALTLQRAKLNSPNIDDLKELFGNYSYRQFNFSGLAAAEEAIYDFHRRDRMSAQLASLSKDLQHLAFEKFYKRYLPNAERWQVLIKERVGEYLEFDEIDELHDFLTDLSKNGPEATLKKLHQIDPRSRIPYIGAGFAAAGEVIAFLAMLMISENGFQVLVISFLAFSYSNLLFAIRTNAHDQQTRWFNASSENIHVRRILRDRTLSTHLMAERQREFMGNNKDDSIRHSIFTFKTIAINLIAMIEIVRTMLTHL